MEQVLAASLARTERGDGLRLIAEWDGEVVGCGQLVGWFHNQCEVADLVVTPSFRRRGIGRALIQALKAEAARLGYAAVEIGVQADNRRALALYQQLGFAYQRTVQWKVDGRPVALLYLRCKV